MSDTIFYPDVAGYYLIDAINELNERSIEISNIKITAPPKHIGEAYNDNFRVLRISAIDKNKVELLICDPNM